VSPDHAEYRELLRRSAALDDTSFAEYVSDLRYPAHLEELVTFLRSNVGARSLCLLPRGHAKTTAVIQATARLIGEHRGRVKVGILTEADEDAVKRSLEIRRIVSGPRFAEVFPWARAGVQGAKWTEAEWTVRGAESYVEKDATLLAGSLLSVKPGPRFDHLVLDDLIGPDEVTTPAMRAKVLERFSTVIEPMLVPTGTIWALGTRWHDDDLYHSWISQMGWPVLLRRAIGDDGAALWPTYWSIERLRAKRTALGSASFDLQYQNDPSGMGGNIFRRDWFRTVRSLPETGLRRGGMDLNASSNERSDYTAYVEVFEDTDRNLYICGSWRARLAEGHRAWLTGVDDTHQPLDSMAAGPCLLWPLGRLPEGYAGATSHPSVARPLAALNIEATSFQTTFASEVLARTRLPARKVHPDRDKVTRSRTLAARMESGKVFFLEGAPGIDELQRELVGFPNGGHDDQVDALVYAADLNPGNEFYFTSAQR
jgi:hypothetical protein